MESNKHWILLKINATNGTPHRFVITGSNFTIGRQSAANILCKSTTVSRNHAVLSVNTEDFLFVKDLNSVNGTLVNNEKIVAGDMHRLFENDVVCFGGLMGIKFIVKKENGENGDHRIPYLYEDPPPILDETQRLPIHDDDDRVPILDEDSDNDSDLTNEP